MSTGNRGSIVLPQSAIILACTIMTLPARPIADHILSFAQTFRGGGVERALLRLVDGWITAGRKVTIVVGKCEGPLAAEVPPGTTIIEVGSARFTALRAVASHARQCQPDIIFCPGNHYTSVALWTRLALGNGAPPIIAKISNTLVRSDQPLPLAMGYRWWLRRHPAFIDHFVAMTAGMKHEAIAAMRADPALISVIANPLPRSTVATPFPDLPDRPVLVGVGRLESQKRWDRLIAALPLLGDQRTRLIIIGDGRRRAALQAQIARLGLGDRVSLPGYVNDPGPYLAQASAVVLTSDFEGVPGVLREALMLGTPVVATDSSPAIREIITSPTMGSVVPKESQAALVAALDAWLAVDAARAPPPPAPQANAATAYLTLFDTLVRQRPNRA